MAEGILEEESNEMLGPTLAPVLHTMQTPVPSNLSSREEVSGSLKCRLNENFALNMIFVF